MDETKIGFSTDSNYLKRSNDFTGTTTVTLPAYGDSVTHPVTHSLGYIPQFEVFVDIDNDGTIWSSEKVDQYTDSSLSGTEDPASPQVSYWSTTTELVIRLDNFTNPVASGTRPIYWIIYLDYGNV